MVTVIDSNPERNNGTNNNNNFFFSPMLTNHVGVNFFGYS